MVEEINEFYSQNENNFDPSKFLKALVTPRPVAFVTSLNPYGVVNAAPYSYFNIVCTNPCLISISVGRRNGIRKDTALNVLDKNEFVVNICPRHFADVLNFTSQYFPNDVSEIDMAQLKLLPSKMINTPRVGNTLAQLECILEKAIEIGDDPVDLLIGKVVNIHVLKEVMDANGYVDRKLFNPIARCVGNNYQHE